MMISDFEALKIAEKIENAISKETQAEADSVPEEESVVF